MRCGQKLKVIIITMQIGLLGLIVIAKSDPNTSVNLLWCNAYGYLQGSTYADSVAYVLADLVDATSAQQSFDYSTLSPYAAAVSHGHATCNTALSNNHCADCLIAARATLTSGCHNSIGGRVEMVDCAIRYENYPFR